jgi:hypothetical protein
VARDDVSIVWQMMRQAYVADDVAVWRGDVAGDVDQSEADTCQGLIGG